MTYTYERKLRKGKIIRRYKRFFADIILDSGEEIVAHVPNTGSMRSCYAEGWKCVVSDHTDTDRKLKYTLEFTQNSESFILVNTGVPNKLIKNAIVEGAIPELAGYSEIIPEFKIGKSRLDLLLRDENLGQCFVEIKNVTLKEGRIALFPDAVTERGQKHLEELISIKKEGHRAVIFFHVGRTDVDSFSPAKNIDPKYAELLSDAYAQGIEILCYQSEFKNPNILIKQKIPFDLK